MDRRSKDWRWSSQIASQIRASLTGADPLDNAKAAYKRAERCGICGPSEDQHPLRGHVVRVVDAMLLEGASYRDVLASIEPLVADLPEDGRPSYWQLRNHARRHLEADARIVRAIVEAEAVEGGVDLECHETPLVTPQAVFRITQQRFFEALVRRELQPTVREGLQASRFLDVAETEDLRRRLVQAEANISLLLSVLREIASSEQIEIVYKRIGYEQALPDGWKSGELTSRTHTDGSRDGCISR
jgi:hypothetical protein